MSRPSGHLFAEAPGPPDPSPRSTAALSGSGPVIVSYEVTERKAFSVTVNKSFLPLPGFATETFSAFVWTLGSGVARSGAHSGLQKPRRNFQVGGSGEKKRSQLRSGKRVRMERLRFLFVSLFSKGVKHCPVNKENIYEMEFYFQRNKMKTRQEVTPLRL